VLNNLRDNMRARAFRKFVSNPHHYPAAAIAGAAVAAGVAPVTAGLTSGHHAAAPVKPATTVTAPAKPASAPATHVVAKTVAAPVTAHAQMRAAAPANAWSGSGIGQLLPNGTDASQSHITLDSAQWANATSIVKAAQGMHLSPYAATIAVATSMQESKLQNLNVAVDHDSLGLFQQRPSCGWGTPNQLENPTYAATAFLKQLPSNYRHMQLDVAAQTVQDSFDGQLYAQWETQAAHIVSSIVNS
jgi:hypothetical protein